MAKKNAEIVKNNNNGTFTVKGTVKVKGKPEPAEIPQINDQADFETIKLWIEENFPGKTIVKAVNYAMDLWTRNKVNGLFRDLTPSKKAQLAKMEIVKTGTDADKERWFQALVGGVDTETAFLAKYYDDNLADDEEEVA